MYDVLGDLYLFQVRQVKSSQGNLLELDSDIEGTQFTGFTSTKVQILTPGSLSISL